VQASGREQEGRYRSGKVEREVERGEAYDDLERME
jgi:hypothetical protein